MAAPLPSTPTPSGIAEGPIRSRDPGKHDRLEGLPRPHPPPLEPLLEPGEDPGEEGRAADEQHVDDVLDPGLAVLEGRGEARVEAAVEAVRLEERRELRA